MDEYGADAAQPGMLFRIDYDVLVPWDRVDENPSVGADIGDRCAACLGEIAAAFGATVVDGETYVAGEIGRREEER